MKVVVMGVSGAGKTTLGAAIADAMNAVFLDGDDLHPDQNVLRMANGQPLTDEMRWPWLSMCAEEMLHHDRVVLACSALKRSYRDYLRATIPELRLVYRRMSPGLIRSRLEGREGHFMPTTLLDSQFDTLEPPQSDEMPVLVPSGLGTDQAVRLVEAVLISQST